MLLALGCKSKKNCFVVIDEIHFSTGNAFYSIYTPDTNWVEMEKYAKDLLKDNEKHSAVGFYNSIDTIFKFKENGAIKPGSSKYLIALYNYKESEGKLIFFKDIENLKNIKLNIKSCK